MFLFSVSTEQFIWTTYITRVKNIKYVHLQWIRAFVARNALIEEVTTHCTLANEHACKPYVQHRCTDSEQI